MEANSEWNEQHRVAESIRRRPGMHLGGVDIVGLHRLANELLEYSLAEVTCGHCNYIQLQINRDGSLTIADNGRAIPITPHPEADLSTLEWVMSFSNSVECRDGKRLFQSKSHGAGACVVAALSEWTEATVCHEGRLYRQCYERGIPLGDVCDIGHAGERVGTTITFRPDPEIFPDITFDYVQLAERLRGLAFLEHGLTTKIIDESVGRQETFLYPGCIVDYVNYLNHGTEVLHEPFHVKRTVDGIVVAIAMQFTVEATERIRCYANNDYNAFGGSHRSGFLTGLTKTLEQLKRVEMFANIEPAETAEDIRKNLTAIVHVKLPEPQFESQSKLRLNNSEVEPIVASLVETEFTAYLKKHPEIARRIVAMTAKAISQVR